MSVAARDDLRRAAVRLLRDGALDMAIKSGLSAYKMSREIAADPANRAAHSAATAQRYPHELLPECLLLGKAYAQASQPDRATYYLEQASTIAGEGPYPEASTNCALYSIIAELYMLLGSSGEAERHYGEYCTRVEAHFGTLHLATGDCYNLLAAFYTHHARYEPALDYCNRALKIRVQLLGVDHESTSDSHYNLGLLYRLHGEPHQARSAFQKALRIRTSCYGEHALEAAEVNVSAGFTDHQLGRLADASAHYSHAYAVRRTRLGEDHPDTDEALSLLRAVRKTLGLPAALSPEELDMLWVPVPAEEEEEEVVEERMRGKAPHNLALEPISSSSPSSSSSSSPSSSSPSSVVAERQPMSTRVHVSRSGSISIQSTLKPKPAPPPSSSRAESKSIKRLPSARIDARSRPIGGVELKDAIDAVNRHAAEKRQDTPVPDATKARMIRVVSQAQLTPIMFEETFMYSVPSGTAQAISRTLVRARQAQKFSPARRGGGSERAFLSPASKIHGPTAVQTRQTEGSGAYGAYRDNKTDEPGPRRGGGVGGGVGGGGSDGGDRSVHGVASKMEGGVFPEAIPVLGSSAGGFGFYSRYSTGGNGFFGGVNESGSGAGPGFGPGPGGSGPGLGPGLGPGRGPGSGSGSDPQRRGHSRHRSADGLEHFDHGSLKANVNGISAGINVLRGQVLRAAVLRRVEDRRANGGDSASASVSRATYAAQCIADVLDTCQKIDTSGSGVVSSTEFADAMTVHRLTDGMSVSEVQAVVQTIEQHSAPGMVNYHTTLPELLKAVNNESTDAAVATAAATTAGRPFERRPEDVRMLSTQVHKNTAGANRRVRVTALSGKDLWREVAQSRLAALGVFAMMLRTVKERKAAQKTTQSAPARGMPRGVMPRGGPPRGFPPRGAPRGGPRGAPRGAPRGGPRGGPRGRGGSSKKTRGNNMKNLHWETLNDDSISGTIWETTAGADGRITSGQFGELFGDIEAEFKLLKRGKGKLGKKDAAKDDGKSKVTLIKDGKRSQNINIMLGRLTHHGKRPVAEIAELVRNLDAASIGMDGIEALLLNAPLKAESKLVNEYTGDPSRLGKPEAYVLALSKVPQLFARLRSMLFELQIDDLVNSVKATTGKIMSACADMRSSEKFVRLLGIVLQIGNSMNKGTSKGGAKGIQLDSLMKLTQTRTNSGQTLLEYIIVHITEKCPDLLALDTDLESVPEAAKVAIETVRIDVNKIKQGCTGIRNGIKADDATGSAIFQDKMGGFCERAERLRDEVVAALDEAESEFASLCEYFASPPPPTTTPDSFFRLVANFVNEYMSTVKKVASQKERQEKQAQRDAERAARKAKTASRTGAGAGKKSKRVPHKRVLTGIDMGALAAAAVATAPDHDDAAPPVATPKPQQRIQVASVVRAPPPSVNPPHVDGVNPSMVLKAMRRASHAMGMDKPVGR